MTLTAQRPKQQPKKDISFRLGGELLSFYQQLPLATKTAILERALASYYQQYLI